MTTDHHGLIGHTGFVGSHLLAQGQFTKTYNSSNSMDMRNTNFKTLYCSGLYAVKWLANKNPLEDWQKIEILMENIKTVHAEHAVLISTVDIYPLNTNMDETSQVKLEDHHHYGRHRFQFELFFKEHFPSSTIIRLPGLFGKGLKKNVIFDLINNNYLHAINPNSSFQYYNLENLWSDIQIAINHRLSLVNFATPPILTRDIIELFFPDKPVGTNASTEAHYDVRSKHSHVYGAKNGYIRSRSQVLKDMKLFIESSLRDPS